jgi:hypothetical protein
MRSINYGLELNAMIKISDLQISYMPMPIYTLNSQQINFSESVKNLGIMIDMDIASSLGDGDLKFHVYTKLIQSN